MRSMSISPSARGGAPRASDLRCASRPESVSEHTPRGLPRGKRAKTKRVVPLRDRRFSAACCGELQSHRPVQPPLRSLRGGFTLLEVMIAMAILAISLVAVYQSQSQSVSMAANSRFLTTASLLAQSRMAALDAAVPREVVSGNGGVGGG